MLHRRFTFAVTIGLSLVLIAGLLCAQAPGPAPTPTPAPVTAETPAPTPTPHPAEVQPPPPPPAPPDGVLPIFGRDLFTTMDPTVNSTDAPVPADYRLGAGDTLSIICWNGATEYERNSVVIAPTGTIYLKLLGAVPLAQLTLAQAQEDLHKRYARYYTKFSLTVQLTGQRTIPVFVMGEVVKPGKYLLSSLGTVFTALFAAQGPTDIGSLRTIRLMRGTKLVSEIDVYAYLLRGEFVDAPLQPGDTIFVPLAGTIVSVTGQVRRQAKYELKPHDTLRDALALAGGTTAESADQIRLTRVNAQHAREVQALRLPADGATPLQDGDEVHVFSVLPHFKTAVTLSGAVNRPGLYPLEKAPSVAALLTLAEGTTPDAYLEQAQVERLDPKGNRQVHIINLREILAGTPGADLALAGEDRIIVHSRKALAELLDIVTVTGEVVKPDAYPYQPDMRVADLISFAFGITTKAYLPQAFLYRFPTADQPKLATIDLAKALAKDPAHNLKLLPRDRLEVRSMEAVNDSYLKVEGEVESPRTLAFYDGMRISDALLLAGGLKANVTLDKALIVRLNPNTYTDELITVSLRQVLTRDPAYDLLLANRDRLIIYPLEQTGEYRVVSVEGAVSAPGTYPFIGDMRVSHLLFMAKGPLQTAFTRRADLYRLRADNSTEIVPIDLVEAQKGLLTAANPLLHPRDRLVVSKATDMEEPGIVKIDGYVRKPGVFPLTVGMKLSDLLHLAGGLRPDATEQVALYRLENGTLRTTTIPLAIKAGIPVLGSDPLLQPNDLASIQGNAQYVKTTETVMIEGFVKHPGAYPAYDGSLQKPKTLRALLKDAGGALPDAYPAGMILYRQQSSIHTARQQAELERTNQIIDAATGIPRKKSPTGPAPTLEPTPKPVTPAPPEAPPATPGTPPTTPPATSATPEGDAPPATPAAPTTPVSKEEAQAQNINSISQSLAKVFTTDQGQTVVLVIPPRSMQEQSVSQTIPLDGDGLLRGAKGAKADIELEPGDVIYLPKQPTTVTVLGGVLSNGSILYQAGKPVSYYIDAVGGLAPDGDRSRIAVMRINGVVMPLKRAKAIQPGDIIIVPTKHMLRIIHTRNGIERTLETLSKTALSFLPFLRN